MKKGKKLFFLLVLFTVIVLPKFIAPKETNAAIIIVSVQDWDLIDSGKHLDWGGSTKYSSQFTSGVSVWNNYKSGVIRKDLLTTIEDVTISDFYEVSTTAGVTSSAGTLRFNDYLMSGYSSDQKKNVAIHELGHALGLDHNLASDVMYKYVTTNVTLSINDKASYDEAYRKY